MTGGSFAETARGTCTAPSHGIGRRVPHRRTAPHPRRIVRTTQDRIHDTMTITLFPAPPRIRGDATALPFEETARYRAAAAHARRTLPGPLGELAQRELEAYAEFGYRFGSGGLIPRLAAVLLDGSTAGGGGPAARPA